MSYLIIGSSSGLGRELAYTFGKYNNDLILVSRDKRDLEAIKSDLGQKFETNVKILGLDFSSLESIKEKLLSKKEILSNLKGVMFPIGLMFEDDNLDLDVDKASKILNANYLSIGFMINQLKEYYTDKDFLIVGFGSVSGILGRNLNNFYAAAKRSLESHFESLAFKSINTKLKIHFYTLGYLDTNLAFGKKLHLPKGKVKSLSELVYKNRGKKIVKRFYPNFWGLISLFLKLIPFSIILKFKNFLKN